MTVSDRPYKDHKKGVKLFCLFVVGGSVGALSTRMQNTQTESNATST